MSTIYLLIGSTGEYSDKMEWFLRAYRDVTAANDECEKLNKLAEGLEKLPWEDREKAVHERLMPHDAHAQCDYTGVWYSVVAVPLVEAGA